MSLKIALKGELRTSCETCDYKGPQPDLNSGPSETDAAGAATFAKPLDRESARDTHDECGNSSKRIPDYLGIV